MGLGKVYKTIFRIYRSQQQQKPIVLNMNYAGHTQIGLALTNVAL